MITYKEFPESKIVEFSVDGKINANDYHSLAEHFLAFVEKHGKVRVLKQIKSFDGFDLEILREKLLGELLRHKDNITHAAVVSDEPWIEQIGRFTAPAFACKTRFFKCADIEEAREWLKTATVHSLEVTADSKDNFMCFKVYDKLTHEDYEKTLIPTLEAAIKEYGKARMLVDFGKEYHGIEVAAMWDDTKFGMKHRKDFEKIAIVGGPSWSAWAAKLGEAMMPCEVKAFDATAYDQALKWVLEPVKAKV